MPPTFPRFFNALLGAAIVLLASAPATFSQPLPTRPARVHVVWLDGRTLEDAMATGAQILDRFPDALIVSNETSLGLLRSAGFRVDETAIALPATGIVTLLRDEGRAVLDAAALDAAGAKALWHGGDNWIVGSVDVLPEKEGLLRHHRKALRTNPLRHRERLAERSPALPTTNVTSFAPVITEMINQLSAPALISKIGNLAGRGSVLVGGVPTQFVTRATPTALCDKAEQYVFEQFQGMGFANVAYEPYTFSSTSARNVIATQTGLERPGQIVIIGGHLDSTSPQSSTLAPGANDNASGTATVLQIASILKNYEFKNTIKYIAFTGEEQGLFGSNYNADAALARGDSIIAVVILDMTAWRNLNHKIDIEGEAAWLPLMNVMNDACTQYTTLATDLVLNSFGSDHVPYQDNNYSAFLAIEDEYESYPCYHQTCDTTGWNQEVIGADVMKACLATVAHMAGPRSFYFAHSELQNTQDTSGPYEVIADLTTISPVLPDSVLLHWSRNSGPETHTVMTPTGPPGRYHAFIPGQPSPSTVKYWMSARDNQNRSTVLPSGAPATQFDFQVAGRVAIFTEGFENGAPGWVSGGTTNDWQVATPVGLAEDPATAYAGTKIAGNDITGLGTNLGKYEPFCDNWFETPAIDCSQATEVKLSFARKLATDKSNGGSWDVARILVNNTLIWSNPVTTALIDPAWTLQEYSIGNIADGVASVKVRFAMRANGSVHFGGWNIDDVKLTAVSSAPVAGVEDGERAGVRLLANVPNPGREGTMLRFELASRADVEMAVYDVRGRLVRSVARGAFDPGSHSVRWDGRGEDGTPSAAGVYFYKLTANGASLARKMVLVR